MGQMYHEKMVYKIILVVFFLELKISLENDEWACFYTMQRVE